MLKLYNYESAVCAQKVRLVLAEKGLDWENQYVELKKGEQNEPEYLKLNPSAVVPTLVHDGMVVVESAVIAEYLDEEFPEPPLQPKNAYDRALMRIWAKKIDDVVLSAITVLSFGIAIRQRYLQMTPGEIQARLEKIPSHRERQLIEVGIEHGIESPDFADAVIDMDKILASLETALEDDRPWLLGDALSLADLEYVPYIHRLEHLAMADMFAPYPRMKDWYERLKGRPSFAQSFLSWDEDIDTPMWFENGKKAWPKVSEILHEYRTKRSDAA